MIIRSRIINQISHRKSYRQRLKAGQVQQSPKGSGLPAPPQRDKPKLRTPESPGTSLASQLGLRVRPPLRAKAPRSRKAVPLRQVSPPAEAIAPPQPPPASDLAPITPADAAQLGVMACSPRASDLASITLTDSDAVEPTDADTPELTGNAFEDMLTTTPTPTSDIVVDLDEEEDNKE